MLEDLNCFKFSELRVGHFGLQLWWFGSRGFHKNIIKYNITDGCVVVISLVVDRS